MNPADFGAWLERVATLAIELYGRNLGDLGEELIAGWYVGDTPAEFVAGVFAPE